MNKTVLLPKLVVGGMKKNASSYLPYILITSFSVFAYFVFSAILDNKMMQSMPRAVYLYMLMAIGRGLLVIILIPILYSTNEFLIKQRKNELGLYNVLGLDQKYIAVMMVMETAIIYVITTALGIIMGIVFSKVIFLMLLNISKISLDVKFTVSHKSFIYTLEMFAGVAVVNLGVNLWQVLRAKPVEMMKAGKKGEKDTKVLKFQGILGFCILAAGYYFTLKTGLDSMIFVFFALDVVLVVIGTRLVFKAGSILVLKGLKKRKKIYYKKQNFITISGMLYRMRRNAQSLSDICIFSTMIIITLICTVSLFMGQTDAINYMYPLDNVYQFEADQFKEQEGFDHEITESAQAKALKISNRHEINYLSVKAQQTGNRFEEEGEEYVKLRLVSLADYNACEHTSETLQENEVLFFSPAQNLNSETLKIGEQTYTVKKELQKLSFENKESRDISNSKKYIVFKDKAAAEEAARQIMKDKPLTRIYMTGFDLSGNQENKEAFIKEIATWCSQQPGYCQYKSVEGWKKEVQTMYGGLLFLGVFFGIIFTVCMILNMYYKQLSEGYEDRKNYEVLKQVGMSEKEVRGAIKRQVLLFFFVPLIVAFIHSFVALKVVSGLLTAIYLFNIRLIVMSALGVMVVFGVLYSLSYIMTSRAYYRIVK